ncbi:Phytochrome-like protein cph1 [Fibrella aestuarina BUZ 2]|uniref:histidine kinase n=1 Tax=Fibrella aestuarina BUZ 2 TaxID=1166018 RepID=I0KAD6_9BACT|nr:PAS domain-containing protein [Fibrella aestuarina]CCH01089.1 Phytochrome-like protein cph1 [Fibrella aestuarina BUZ 2]
MTGNQPPSDSSKHLTERLDIDFALEAAGLGVWEIDPATNQVIWDARCQALVGLERDDYLPFEEAIQYIHPADSERVLMAIQWAMMVESGGRFDQTYRTIGADGGRVRWVRFWGQGYFKPTGEVYRFAGVAQDVTVQVQASQQVEESEARFRALVEEAPVATCLFVGRELRIDVANSLMIGFWGKDPSVIGQPLAVAVPELVGQPFLSVLDDVFTTGEPYEARGARAELVVNGVLGTYYFDFTYKPLRNAQGDVFAIMDMAVDVTEQVLARQQLEESELFSRSLFDKSPAAKSVHVGQEMRIRAANAQMLTLWGKEASVVGRPLLEALPELRTTPHLERLRHVLNTGDRFYEAEEKIELIRFGEPYTGYYEYTYEALHDAAGDIYGVMCVCTEVTHQVQARQKVEESEAALQSAIDLAELGTFSVEIATNRTTLSPRMAHWFGLPAVTEVAAMLAVIEESDQEPFQMGFTNDLRTEAVGAYEGDYAIINPLNGRKRILHTTSRTVWNPEGQPLRIDGTAQDVTAQRELQLALKEQVKQRTQQLADANLVLEISQQRLVSIFEQAPVAIALLEGPDYRIKLANASMQAIWQLPEGQELVLNQPVFEAFPNIAGLGLEALLAQVRQTGVAISGNELPVVFLRNGTPETVYINFVYAPISHADGNVDVVVAATEVTEQVVARRKVEESEERYRRLSEQLAVSNNEYAALNEELEEANELLVRSNENLQKFAYIASHDLQEPLRKIQQFGNLLKMRYVGTDNDGLDYLERMQAAAGRMSQLIKDLLDFSRISTQRDTSAAVSLDEIVSRALSTLELTIQETGAQLHIAPLPVISGDALQLGQLFQNLLSNALKFHRPNVVPLVTVRASLVPVAALPAPVKPNRLTANYHRIDVIDNGIGFDEKYLDRIFQVFQRLHSKSEFAGTGIGLAICEKVVVNHGGGITASSEPGQGATFSIYLPVQ